MPKYRITQGSLMHRRETYYPGDVIDLSESLAERHADILAPLDNDDVVDEAALLQNDVNRIEAETSGFKLVEDEDEGWWVERPDGTRLNDVALSEDEAVSLLAEQGE